MFRIILLLLIVVPALEIFLFITVGKNIGAMPTLLMVFLTGMLGVLLTKRQGLSALRNAQQKINNGQMPGDVLIDGLCIFFGGLLLIVPGFLTDFIGLALLFPFFRNLIKPAIFRVIRNRMHRGQYIIINRR